MHAGAQDNPITGARATPIRWSKVPQPCAPASGLRMHDDFLQLAGRRIARVRRRQSQERGLPRRRRRSREAGAEVVYVVRSAERKAQRRQAARRRAGLCLRRRAAGRDRRARRAARRRLRRLPRPGPLDRLCRLRRARRAAVSRNVARAAAAHVRRVVLLADRAVPTRSRISSPATPRS